MDEFLRIFAMGHKMECCWMNFIIVILSYVIIALQVAVVAQAYVIRHNTSGIRYWSTAWSVYFWTMIVICVRRVITLHSNFDVADRLDGRFSTGFMVDNVFLAVISLMWFVFIWKIKAFLSHYYKAMPSEDRRFPKIFFKIRTFLNQYYKGKERG